MEAHDGAYLENGVVRRSLHHLDRSFRSVNHHLTLRMSVANTPEDGSYVPRVDSVISSDFQNVNIRMCVPTLAPKR